MIDASSKSRPLRDVGSTPPAAGDVIADKYRVESVVGSGGMGIVVAARHLQLGQQVAIKLLRLNDVEPERQAESRARFLREGQAAAALSSDHVVRIHDVGTLESGEPFMVMELLRGDDLSAIIERQGSAPIAVAVDYILQACDAVAEAHAAGIVHRDLKPSNLFVSSRSDGRVTLKVLDFGISKAVAGNQNAFDGNLTETRSVVGSPYYMSPEQVRDAKRVDGRSDIWSLGTILYELLTAETPFDATTFPGICAAIAADTPRSLREVRSDVPAELDAVVSKCLEKNPDKRYQTIAELVQALAPFASGGSAAASAAYASRKDVLALSEPFEARPAIPDRNAATIHATEQSGPPSALAVSPTTQVSTGSRSAGGRALDGGSGARRREDLESSATLVSSSTHRERNGTLLSGQAPSAPSAPSRARGVAVAVLVALAALGTWAVVGRHAGPPTSAPAKAYSLTIESTPSGAAVLADGDRVVGTTPCTVPLREALQPGRGRLTLRLNGYEPYELAPPSGDHDVRISAVLSKTPSAEPNAPHEALGSPSAAPAETAAPAPAAPGAPRHAAVSPIRPRAPKPAAPTSANTSAAPDIRLER
ncbi:MAG TPA: serine/threonine-protein kinase [Polyangiaceae bacterium]|nr:serine/threonine-protein kinase [Polyangiaceae bacterium]